MVERKIVQQSALPERSKVTAQEDNLQALKEAFALHESGAFAAAAERYQTLLLDPHTSFDAHHMLGVIAASQKKYGDAFYHFEAALAINETEDLHHNMAWVACIAERMQMLLFHTRKLENLKPEDPKVHRFYARYYLRERDHSKALFHAEKALELSSDSKDKSLQLYCQALIANHQYDAALAKLRPNITPPFRLAYAKHLLDADLYHPQSHQLYWQEAEKILSQLTIQKDQSLAAKAQSLLGQLSELRKEDDSVVERQFRRALQLDPNNPMNALGLGFSLLKQKKWQEGFRLLDSRRLLPNMQVMLAHYQGVPQIHHANEVANIKGANIVIISEQGIGDNVQFMRFVPLLAVFQPATIAMRVPPTLYKLASSLHGVDTIVTDGDSIDNVHFVIPMMSVPSLLSGKDIAQTIHRQSYLSPIGKPRLNLPQPHPDHLPKIGIVWHGNILFSNDKRRSLTLAQMEPILLQTPAAFYSLQKPTSPAFSKLAEHHQNLIDLSAYLNDFNDTAHFLTELDLVISVDTSLLHVCGALGIKAIGILPPNADWRWHHDTQSCWYKSVTLIRAEKNWSDLIPKLHQLIIKTLEIEESSFSPNQVALSNAIVDNLENQEWAQAVKQAQAVTSLTNSPDILHLEGIAALKNGDGDHAVACFKKALAQKPTGDIYQHTLHDLLVTLIHTGNKKQALSVFLKAFEDTQLLESSIIKLVCTRFATEASLYFAIKKKRRKFKDDPSLKQAQIYLLCHQKKLDEAIALLDSYPTDATIAPIWQQDKLWSDVARLAFENKNLELAKTCLEKAMITNPNDLKHVNNHSIILALLGDTNRAILNLQKAISKEPSPSLTAELYTLLVQEGQKERALKYLDNALTHHPNSAMLNEMKKNHYLPTQ